MKIKCFAVTAALVGFISSCEKDYITGNGETKTEERTVAGFNEVSTEGATKIHIVKGTEFEVKVKAYANLLPNLQTIVQNGVLSVKFKNTSSVRNDNSEVFITMPVLTSLKSYGSGNIDATGEFNNNENFNAEIKGSADILLEKGTTGKLNISSAGSGNFKSFGFTAQQAEISISGSGNAEITVTQLLKATINGSGNVYYKGNPAAIQKDISGSGKVIKQ